MMCSHITATAWEGGRGFAPAIVGSSERSTGSSSRRAAGGLARQSLREAIPTRAIANSTLGRSLLEYQKKSVRFAKAYLSDDKAVAKMGHPHTYLFPIGEDDL